MVLESDLESGVSVDMDSSLEDVDSKIIIADK